MEKINFQKSIAQLYIDVDIVKQKIKEQIFIEKFEENTINFFKNMEDKEKFFFKEDIVNFTQHIHDKKELLIKKYKKEDINAVLEEYAVKYFKLTQVYLNTNPDFYDAIINITPVWKEDYNSLTLYVQNLKNKYPNVKITNQEKYTNQGNSPTFGKFEIATDMNTAFSISKEVNGNYTAQIQVIFLAINPAFIPTFSEKGFSSANAIGSNKINNYLDINIIASITKGALSQYDTPINIMKIFLNDVFANKMHYHYIDNQSGHNVTLTSVSKSFISKL